MTKQKKSPSTLDEKIDELLTTIGFDGDGMIAKKEIRLLVEKTASPESFCPECEDRLAYIHKENLLRCLNCGYEDLLEEQPEETPATPTKKGNIPDEAKEALKRAAEPSEKGENIRNLANQMGSSPPTQEDRDQVKAATGIKDANFV